MEPILIEQGLSLMLFGMGSVFVFLTVLVIVTSTMSALVQKFAPQTLPAVPVAAAQPSYREGTVADTHLIAVITAAVHKYRSRHI